MATVQEATTVPIGTARIPRTEPGTGKQGTSAHLPAIALAQARQAGAKRTKFQIGLKFGFEQQTVEI